MSETEMNFGPSWLRALSDGGKDNKGASLGSGGTSNTSGNGQAGGAVQNNSSFKYKLVEYRYGREEMLALFDRKIQIQPKMKDFPGLINDKCQVPLSLVPMTEEEHFLWSRSVNSESAILGISSSGNAMTASETTNNNGLALSDREHRISGAMEHRILERSTSSGSARSGLRTIAGRGRGRVIGGNGSGFYHRGTSFEEDPSENTNGIDRARSDYRGKNFDRPDEAGINSSNVVTRTDKFERSGVYAKNDIRKDMSETDSSWRSNRIRTDNPRIVRDWRTKPRSEESGVLPPSGTSVSSGPSLNSGDWKRGSDRWRQTTGDEDNRRKSFTNSTNRTPGKDKGGWDESEEDRRNLPEWSLDDPTVSDPKFGTFDASGQFREEIADEIRSSHQPTQNSQSKEWNSRTENGVKIRTLEDLEGDKREKNSSNVNVTASPAPQPNQFEPAMDEIMNSIFSQSKTEPTQMLDDEDFRKVLRMLGPDKQIGANDQIYQELLKQQQQKQQVLQPPQQSPLSTAQQQTAPQQPQHLYKEIFDRPELEQQSAKNEPAIDQWIKSEESEPKERIIVDEFGEQSVVFSPSHPNSQMWFYRDPQDQVQGPFSSQDMLEWFNLGYFSNYLLVRRGCDERFSKLGDLFQLWERLPFALSKQPSPIRANAPTPVTSATLPTPAPVASAAPASFHPFGQLPSGEQAPIGLPLAMAQPLAASGFDQAIAPLGHGIASLIGPGPFVPLLAQPTGPLLVAASAGGQAEQQLLFHRHQQMQQQMLNEHQLMQAQLRQLLNQLKKQEFFCALSQEEQQEVLIQQYMQTQQYEQLRRHLIPTSSADTKGPSPPVGDEEQQQPVGQTPPHSEGGPLSTMGQLAMPLLGQQVATSQPAVSAAGQWALNGEVLTASALEEMQRAEIEMREREEAKLKQMQAEEEQRKREERAKIEQERAKVELERLRLEQERQRLAEERAQQEEQQRRRQEEIEHMKAEMEKRKREADEKERKQQQAQQQAQKQVQQQAQQQQAQQQQKLKQQMQAQQQALQQVQQQQKFLKQQQEQQQLQLQVQQQQKLQVQQQSQTQQQHATEKKAVWSNRSANTEPEATSLVEIQKLQEKEREERYKREMVAMAVAAQSQNNAQKQKGWGNVQTKAPSLKTLAEIQREEAECLARIKAAEEEKQQQLAAQSAGVWSNASSQLSWNSSTGVWGQKAAGSGASLATSSGSSEPAFWESDPPLSAAVAAAPTGVKKASDLFKTNLVIAPTKSEGFAAAAGVAKKKQTQQSSHAPKKEEEPKTVNQKGGKTGPNDEFMKWCSSALAKFQSSIDVATFVSFLKDVESPHDVQDYVFSYLGDNKDSKEFSKKFVEKRSYYKNQAKKASVSEEVMWGPAPAITPVNKSGKADTESDFSFIKKKKKKGGKKSDD